MNKKKIIIVVAFFILCVSGGLGTGYVLKANSNLNEEISSVYNSIPGKLEIAYLDANQVAEYNKLLEEKEVALKEKKLDKLKDIQQKIIELQKVITKKKEDEAKTYAEKKTVVEAIVINDGATTEEQQMFDTLKTEILQMITDKKEIATIDVKITELNTLVTTITNNVNERNESRSDDSSYTPSYDESSEATTPETDPTPTEPEQPTEQPSEGNESSNIAE